MITVLLKDETEDARNAAIFGGTTPLGADLDDAVVDELEMRAALERFATALAKQYQTAKFRDAKDTRIVGVRLHSLEFSFVTKRVKS